MVKKATIGEMTEKGNFQDILYLEVVHLGNFCLLPLSKDMCVWVNW